MNIKLDAQFCCLNCGGKNKEIIKKHTRGGESEHLVVQCCTCGLQQLFPLPTIEEDEIYYDENSHDRGITPEFSMDEIYNKFEYQNISRKNYILEEIKPDMGWNIMDYACGYGFFIEMMEKEGYKMEGVEISKDRRSVCKERLTKETYSRIYSFNLLNESIPTELEGKYQLITMFHLLEHIITPFEFLKKVKNLLSNNGILVLELPNVSNSMMDISQEFNDFFYIRDHVAYYSPQIVKDLLERAGFCDIEIKGIQMHGLFNHVNWILNKEPQREKPDYIACEGMQWIEKIYKEELEKQIKSEYMYIIARVKNNKLIC